MVPVEVSGRARLGVARGARALAFFALFLFLYDHDGHYRWPRRRHPRYGKDHGGGGRGRPPPPPPPLSLRSELACPPILPLLRPCSPSSLNSPPNGNASSSTLRSNSPSSSKWNTSLNSRGLFVREPRLPIISHEEEEEEDDGVQVQVPVEVEVGKTAAAMRRNKKKKKKKEEEEREAPMSPRRKRGCASVGSRLPPPPPPPLFRARIALLRPTTTPNSPPSRCSTRLGFGWPLRWSRFLLSRRLFRLYSQSRLPPPSPALLRHHHHHHHHHRRRRPPYRGGPSDAVAFVSRSSLEAKAVLRSQPQEDAVAATAKRSSLDWRLKLRRLRLKRGSTRDDDSKK